MAYKIEIPENWSGDERDLKVEGMDLPDYINDVMSQRYVSQYQIIENCIPSSLEKKDHLYIHRFKTLYPVGLNKNKPFGLAMLS